MANVDQLEPNRVFRFFSELSAIPRGSGNERGVSDWIKRLAETRGLEVEQDESYNLLVRKPGTPGFTSAPTVILHGHMDMVCERIEGSAHDFVNDPLTLLVDEEYITADGTSLGADNGIGVSYILALLESDDIPHPPLEAVITVMEEKGKVGAANFDASRLRGSRMIDFNWITDDEILAGCGGDLTLTVDIPTDWEPVDDASVALELAVRGLRGGHCEFDIHLERANAIVVLGRLLRSLSHEESVRVSTISGGVQNTAIPSDATATIVASRERYDAIAEVLSREIDIIRSEFSIAEPGLRLDVSEVDLPAECQTVQKTADVARAMILIPHGVISWSLTTPGIVECSNNLGTIRTETDAFRLMTTITAGVTSRKHQVARQIKELAQLVNGSATEYGLDAPEFPYNPDSTLLRIAREAYRDVVGVAPATRVSNCSLELGMFTQRIPQLDTISVGTNLSGLHSPDERVSHLSVAKVWPFVTELVGRLST